MPEPFAGQFGLVLFFRGAPLRASPTTTIRTARHATKGQRLPEAALNQGELVGPGLNPGDLRPHLARTLAPRLPPVHPVGRVPARLADRVPAVPALRALIRGRIQPFARALQPAHTPSVSPRQDSA